MKANVIMVAKESTVGEVIHELSSVMAKENIFLKVMDDDMFDVAFKLDTEEIQADMDDDIFMFIAKKAHEEDITFNQMITKILREQINKMDKQEK